MSEKNLDSNSTVSSPFPTVLMSQQELDVSSKVFSPVCKRTHISLAVNVVVLEVSLFSYWDFEVLLAVKEGLRTGGAQGSYPSAALLLAVHLDIAFFHCLMSVSVLISNCSCFSNQQYLRSAVR